MYLWSRTGYLVSSSSSSPYVFHRNRVVEYSADLHIHTTASDGALAPEEIVRLALGLGLKAIAITDHDAVEGVAPALAAARGSGCEVIPGVELSTTIDGVDLHLLGFFVDVAHNSLLEQLSKFRRVRDERAEKIVRKLQELGVVLEIERVREIAGGGAIGRPHIAEALVQAKAVKSNQEAFHRFLGYKGPAYVPKFKISPKAGIDLVRASGGIAVLAHPGSVRRDELIPQFVADGLQGLEVIHPDHVETVSQHYMDIARKHGLIMTGGSDFHGSTNSMSSLGEYPVPYDWVETMKGLVQRCRRG